MAILKENVRKKKAPKYKQGKFSPLNPKKYRGNVHNIVFRSGWERRVMKYMDMTPSILAWNSEEVVVPYRDPFNDRGRRYFLDFWFAIKKDGKIVEYLVEVKPYKQTIPPVPPKINNSKALRRYAIEQNTYIRNVTKWKAARRLCEARGMHFILMTEYELGIKPKRR